MYIIRNALKCIGRSVGRNVLIGVIVLVIAVSACIGLSIRQAAENAREDTLSTLSVTATISFDRQSAMSGMMQPPSGEGGDGDGGGRGSFDREQFAQMMGGASSLTLEEYQVYAASPSVKEFYYSLSLSVNGGEGLEPVSTDTDTDTDTDDTASVMPGGGMGGGRFEQMMGMDSDFTVVGYSGESAMTDFINGTASVTTGSVFAEGTAAYECIISEELALFNELAVGDTILIANPNNEEETYPLTITGLYTDTTANENSFSMMGATVTDPANRIYMSYTALQDIVDASGAISETQTDENTGMTFETGLSGSLSATYTFEDVAAYEQFETDVRELGLDESYTVFSADLTAFENSLAPLETLSTTAGYFLIVILVIGAIILIVLNIFNVRERKYEIGVLTAMGMKKQKVALQFLTEIFVVTLAAVILGAGIGAIGSVPVADALLENQITSQQNQNDRIEQNFGRGEPGGQLPDDLPQKGDFFESLFGGEMMTEINATVDLTVLLQMLGIAVLLTLAAGMVSMLFVMRYEPLKILANRD